jgi:hypothetical protein
MLKRFEVVIILEAHGSDDLFEQILKFHKRSHKVSHPSAVMLKEILRGTQGVF